MKELTAEESKSIKEWCAKEKTVTLTNGEWSKLTTYLLLSKNHREGEAKAWAELAEEREEDGIGKGVYDQRRRRLQGRNEPGSN